MSESTTQEKSRSHTATRAISAFYKLAGWIVIGVGFGFSLTLFSFAASLHNDSDRMIALGGGLICILLTILVFVLAYGLSEMLKVLLEIEDDCEAVSSRMAGLLDKIEVEPEMQAAGPRIDELGPPPGSPQPKGPSAAG